MNAEGMVNGIYPGKSPVSERLSWFCVTLSTHFCTDSSKEGSRRRFFLMIFQLNYRGGHVRRESNPYNILFRSYFNQARKSCLPIM